MFVSVLNLLFLVTLGTTGYLIFRFLRLPLPALLGSLTITALLAICGLFPSNAPLDVMSLLCKIAIGVMMGRRISREFLKMIRKIASPAILVSVWMILLSIASGKLLAILAGIPLSTALVGCTTGGVSEMAIFALSKNYDVATITVIQTFRLASTLAITPWLARKWSERLGGGDSRLSASEGVRGKSLKTIRCFSWREMLILVFFAAAGGLTLQALGVPAGAMLGALALSGAFCVMFNKSYVFPTKVTAAAQIGIGIAVGRQFGPSQLATLTNIRFLFAVMVSTAFVMLGVLLLSYILQKMTRWSPLTCLLSASAGGMTQMVVVAEEMNADPLTIGILHLARYLTVVSYMPFLVTYLLG